MASGFTYAYGHSANFSLRLESELGLKFLTGTRLLGFSDCNLLLHLGVILPSGLTFELELTFEQGFTLKLRPNSTLRIIIGLRL